MLNYKNNMSCPTCTDPKFCTVDRRCTGKMNMDTCNLAQAEAPDQMPPYYETTMSGRVVPPYLTRFIPGVHDRSIEGFGFLGLSQNNLILLTLLLAVVYYLYTQRQ